MFRLVRSDRTAGLSCRVDSLSCAEEVTSGGFVEARLALLELSVPADVSGIASTLVETARIVEDAGFHRFTVMDHDFQMEHRGTAAEPMLEGYTTLGYVAARTERLQLGLLVTGVMYRYPGLLRRS